MSQALRKFEPLASPAYGRRRALSPAPAPAACPADEPYRPLLHFSPPSGWMNDPNGLIHTNGLWHLYYQHTPGSLAAGPMHWGHASSRDLVNWRHHPLALEPDHLGCMFSGSAVEDSERRTGLFSGDGSRLIAFYTASRPLPGGGAEQVQCLATSEDGGDSWRKSARNPILAEPGLSCFRDPKVSWYAPGACWLMAVTRGSSIAFYRSDNALDWQELSAFSSPGSIVGDETVWECPDILPIRADDGQALWLLIVSVNGGAPWGGSGTQYFIGDFDGSRFVAGHDEPRWLDHGSDCYAAQTWAKAPDGRLTRIAWMSNWRYAAEQPTQRFAGAMTLARELSITHSAGGYRLHQSYPESVAGALAFGSASAPGSEGLIEISSPLYRISARLSLGESGCAGIALFGAEKCQYCFRRLDERSLVLTCHRFDASGRLPETFNHCYQTIIEPVTGPFDIELVVDAGLCELTVADGLAVLAHAHYPAEPAAPVCLCGSGWRGARAVSVAPGALAR